jgi:hypothetical protein
MLRITDQDYYLPEVYPQLFNDQFTNSANKPILISGIDKRTGKRNDYVIKFKKAERMSEEASMRELLASFIALQLDVNVVSPAIVEVDVQFVELLKGHDCWLPGSKSLGYNYGSAFLDDHRTLLLNLPLNMKQLAFAQDIFCFDLLIQNFDRTKEKPNLLTNGEYLVALDHEVAFGFIFTPFLPAMVWEMHENNKDWIRNHCLLPLIKGKPYDFEGFVNRFDDLTEQFWQKAWELIPQEWRNEQFQIIREKLTMMVTQKENFTLELKKILS